MKNVFIFLFVNAMVMHLGVCQTCNKIHFDTLLSTYLTDGRGVDYQAIQTIATHDSHYVDSTRKLIICYYEKKSIIHLPIPDEEVKNFSIEGITANDNGITLITSQGGGPCIIRRAFVFKIVLRQLFLDRIISEYGGFGTEEKQTDIKSFHPNLKIEEINLLTFL